MANEVTVPLLPCESIDEISEFYQALGFTVTHRQERPNPHLAIRREDFHLHFFGMPGFKAEDSYGTCLVTVEDIGALYAAFAEGMRAAHGKLLIAGIPRMTRPRKRKNSGDLSGFSIVDPGGNWIRIFQAASEPASVVEPASGAAEPGDAIEPASAVEPARGPASKLARALENAIVLGESKGDHRQAAKILDATLARHDGDDELIELVQALVYRAELAVVLHDPDRANALLAQVRSLDLTEDDQRVLVDALQNADDLAETLRAG